MDAPALEEDAPEAMTMLARPAGRALSFALAALLLASLASSSASDASKPNLVFVLFDDLGYGEADEPFFLYFPMCPPHTPIAPSPEFIGRSGATDEVKNDPKYGDWVFQGDDMLGQILDALEQRGLAENKKKGGKAK